MALDSDVTSDDAVRYLRYIEQMTWRQMCALAYFNDKRRDAFREELAAAGKKQSAQIRPSTEYELSELARIFELIGMRSTEDESVNNPSNTWGSGRVIASTLDSVALTGQGATLHRLAELASVVSRAELDRFEAEELRGDS